MITVYGIPALEVENPDGEIVPYVFRQVRAEDGERRAFVVTKPDGDENRCSERLGGNWKCTCKAFIYRDRWSVEKQGRCKHAAACVRYLEERRKESTGVA